MCSSDLKNTEISPLEQIFFYSDVKSKSTTEDQITVKTALVTTTVQPIEAEFFPDAAQETVSTAEQILVKTASVTITLQPIEAEFFPDTVQVTVLTAEQILVTTEPTTVFKLSAPKNLTKKHILVETMSITTTLEPSKAEFFPD